MKCSRCDTEASYLKYDEDRDVIVAFCQRHLIDEDEECKDKVNEKELMKAKEDVSLPIFFSAEEQISGTT